MDNIQICPSWFFKLDFSNLIFHNLIFQKSSADQCGGCLPDKFAIYSHKIMECLADSKFSASKVFHIINWKITKPATKKFNMIMSKTSKPLSTTDIGMHIMALLSAHYGYVY